MNARGLTRDAAYFLFIIVLSLPFFVSCKKKEERPSASATVATNPYSNESVFDEVKRQLDKNPKDVDALYHLADLYDRNNQYAEAIETYKKVVALKPDLGYAYLKMGTAYDRLNKPEEAIREFKKAAKHMPKNPVVYNNMGVAYGKLGKYHEEVSALKKALSLRASYSAAAYNLGATYLKLKDKKAAMRAYESLKKFDEGAADALMKEINKAS
jgi:tetratricopeptide (TPR) repeat protein